MILQLEDYETIAGITITVLTPIYYLTFKNAVDISQIKQQVHEIQKRVKIY